jgi:alkylation response protein AidB-like acyl-CoA dehydrogenase
MDLRPDPLHTQLRRALRAGLSGVTPAPGVSGPPVPRQRSGTAAVLAELGAAAYETPVSDGGLGLGLTAGVIVSEELGRAACGNPYRAAALTADAVRAADRAGIAGAAGPETAISLAGLAELPPGSGVTATRVPAAPSDPAAPPSATWELSGTVALDGLGGDLIAVVCGACGEPMLALLPAGSPGCEISDEWPGTLRLTRVTVGADQVLRPLAVPVDRARIRQAGYLLGLAAGMLAAAVSYTGGRTQFGSRLRDLPPVAFPMARQTIALRGARLLCYRAAWLADSTEPGAAAAEALAAGAEVLSGVARVSMQVCGVRAMTPELGLHRYYRLAGTEVSGHGHPADLWRLAGAARLGQAHAGSQGRP